MQNRLGRLGLISSQAFSIHNFRGPLVRELVAQDVRVYAFAPDYDDFTRKAVAALGAEPVDYSMQRAGISLMRDAADVVGLVRKLRRSRLDAVLAYFVKPVIYGSLAAWLAGIQRRFSIIEGLGYVFATDGCFESFKRRALRRVVSLMYRLALALNEKVFFLNSEDIIEFESNRFIAKEKIVKLNGIGVDLDYYAPVPVVKNPVTFILVARLLKEKGVYDYIDAARRVLSAYPDARFLLVGGIDPNPGSVMQSELKRWAAEGLVDWVGPVADVRPWIAKASVCVLPSYYREGVPRGNQEAMAMGRPLITTDWVGCRETVKHGVNGFLVPVRDPGALSEAMVRFIRKPELIEIMGLEGRRMAETKFNVHPINQVILRAIGVVTAGGTGMMNFSDPASSRAVITELERI